MTVEVPFQDGSQTQYCYRYKDCPVGAQIEEVDDKLPALSYSPRLAVYNHIADMMNYKPLYCPRPEDGRYIVGYLPSDHVN